MYQKVQTEETHGQVTGGSSKQADAATKPGGVLIRTWVLISGFYLRFIELFRTLLRSVGLGILTFVRGPSAEPPKRIFDSSRKLVLARCAIHIVPSFVSIGLITVNLTGYFLGGQITGPGDDNIKLSIFQVAAKIQELLTVSSVATVIFHVLRSELVFGDGVPLGLLISGWSFTSASYFWSAEFWGGAFAGRKKAVRRWRRRGFVVLVLVSGVLAVVAGPASAILMIPRVSGWPIGGGIFWLNGSDAQLWPTDLQADYFSDTDCSSESLRYPEPRCPSAGFMPLFQHYTTWWDDESSPIDFELVDSNLRKSMHAVPAAGFWANTWAYTAHAATATLQDAIRDLHRKALSQLRHSHPLYGVDALHLSWATSVRFDVLTKAPAVRVMCLPQGAVDLSGDITLDFPNFAQFDAFWNPGPPDGAIVPVTPPNPDRIDVSEEVQQHLFKRGIATSDTPPLDSGVFNNSRPVIAVPIETGDVSARSLGVVVLLGTAGAQLLSPMTSAPSNVLACSVDARWAKAKTFFEMDPTQQLNHDFVLGKVMNLVGTELDVAHNTGIGVKTFLPPDDGSMENIKLHPSWLDRVAPVMPDELSLATSAASFNPAQTNETTLEKLLDVTYSNLFTNQGIFEKVISTTVADGLSRSGLIPNFNSSRFLGWPYGNWVVDTDDIASKLVRKGTPEAAYPEPSVLENGNVTQMTMRATYTGYVMAASSWFDYFCVAALLVHALIALSHTIWVVWHKETSGAWDTILEMIALTQLSQPPQDVLTNASTGIRSFKTVRLVAWVETPPDDAEAVGEQEGRELQLRIGESIKSRRVESIPVVGQIYGKELESSVELRRRSTRDSSHTEVGEANG